MFFEIASIGLSLLSGAKQQSSANKAAAAAAAAGEYNAKIIERDIDLLEKQRQIVNANFLTQSQRARTAFERDVQGAVRAGFGYGGIDIAQGTPLEVLRDNAREFQYEADVAAFNNEVANMQISDQQEGSRMSAELSRMEGGANAASLRAQGAASMISSIGQAAGTAYEYKILG
jgi:hypothetical protein